MKGNVKNMFLVFFIFKLIKPIRFSTFNLKTLNDQSFYVNFFKNVKK